MRVEITNLQKKNRVSRPALVRLTRWLMQKASSMDPSRSWLECSIVLVGHDRMTELNQEAMHHEGTTDVITFAYPTHPGEPEGWRGEIVVNIDEAMDVSSRRNSDPARELALYIAHGCQHLGGADDRTATERGAMSRRQNRWLAEAGKLGLLDFRIHRE